jgi:hypothetical protein
MTRAELPEEEPQIAQISQIVLCKNINTRGHPERSSAAATWGRTQLKDPVEPPATSMPFLFTSLAADFRGQRRPKRVEGPRGGAESWGLVMGEHPEELPATSIPFSLRHWQATNSAKQASTSTHIYKKKQPARFIIEPAVVVKKEIGRFPRNLHRAETKLRFRAFRVRFRLAP